MNSFPESHDARKLASADAADSTSEGSADNLLIASGEIDPRRAQTELRLPSGQVLRVPTLFLLEQSWQGLTERVTSQEHTEGNEPFMIPVIEEQLEVGKRTVVTGTVLLEKQIQEYEETLDVPLAVRSFDVERVVLNQPVEAPPAVRQEGNTTIYPLVEEQLVLTTQLILKEEVRVTQRDTERRDTRTVTLKRESMTVTRKPAAEEQGAAGDGPQPG